MSEAECSEPNGMLGVFSPDGIPSQASLVDYNDDGEQLNSDFQLKTDQNAQVGPQSSSRYDKAAVLLISWDRSYDDPNTEREPAEADTFEISDCCFAGNLGEFGGGSNTKGTKREQIVSAGLEIGDAIGGGGQNLDPRCFEFLHAPSSGMKAPGPSSFTSGLIWALRVLAKERPGRFTTSTLANKIREAPNFPKQQMPIISERDYPSERIVIAPLMGVDEFSALTRYQKLEFLCIRSRRQGKRALAEKVYELALYWKELALGPNHSSTLENTNTSGSVHAFRGLYTEAEEREKWDLGNHHLPDATSSTGFDSSETASIASVARSDSSKSSVSMGASDTLEAGLEEMAEFLLSDKELYQIFAEALTRHNRDKVLKNGARLLKWFGRRLVVSAGKTVEREAAEFFQNRRHCRSIMDRIALQIPENLTDNIRQGQRAQGRFQKLINRERLEAHLRHTIETTVPIDNESEHSIDSEDEQQNEEEKPNLNLDAAKSFLKSSDALVRLKEEMGDLINPFASKAMWKKTLWIDGRRVYFELPNTVPESTRIDILKLALEQYVKMPIIWWPFKQPRRCLSSNKVRIVLPCVSKKFFFRFEGGTEQRIKECGFEAHVDVSHAKARKYRQMCATDLARSRPGQHPILPTSNVSSSRWSAPGQVPVSASVSLTWAEIIQQRRTRNRNTLPQGQGLDPNANVVPQTHPTPEYIHWCVDAAPQRTLLYEICKERKKGKDFINELCRSYRRIRGWRWYFSMTTCTEIRFVNVIHVPF
ncbi:MAG: hypothetical protein Q9178_003767 [Gyalolechia marmorata]